MRRRLMVLVFSIALLGAAAAPTVHAAECILPPYWC